MSEEEIIKKINKTLEIINSRAFYEYVGDGSVYMTAITDLLDLYKKEKEKNKGLEIKASELNGLAEVVERDYIHKDKIKEALNIPLDEETNTDLVSLIKAIFDECDRLEDIEEKLDKEKEKNKQLEEKLKIAIAMLTRGTYPEENEGDNDFDKHYISKDKIKEEIEHLSKNILDIENITMLKGKTLKEQAEIELYKYAICVLTRLLEDM